MESNQLSEEAAFTPEHFKRPICKIIEEAIGDTIFFDENMIPRLSDEICEKTMEILTDFQRPYKYIGKLNNSQETGL